jgi:ATP-dependent DNA helicase DinG
MLLASEFRDDVTSVLLGTTSFWTGIDIQGEALSCVFIDKLPFPEMGNPVLDALGDRYDDVFSRFSLPRTIMMFRQGIGRLIRSVHDRGVMVVLDQRLRTKNYGHGFIRSLPAMPHADSLDAIRTFFEHEHGATWTPAAVQARAKAVEQEQAFPF